MDSSNTKQGQLTIAESLTTKHSTSNEDARNNNFHQTRIRHSPLKQAPGLSMATSMASSRLKSLARSGLWIQVRFLLLDAGPEVALPGTFIRFLYTGIRRRYVIISFVPNWGYSLQEDAALSPLENCQVSRVQDCRIRHGEWVYIPPSTLTSEASTKHEKIQRPRSSSQVLMPQ